MKKHILLIIAVSAFSALVLWISGLATYFYSLNVYIFRRLFDFISSFF
ncbi:MAG TPA: hypothetical protein PLZ43_04225 [bacterium]|nr:hypothetical protein [bacterium]